MYTCIPAIILLLWPSLLWVWSSIPSTWTRWACMLSTGIGPVNHLLMLLSPNHWLTSSIILMITPQTTWLIETTSDWLNHCYKIHSEPHPFIPDHTHLDNPLLPAVYRVLIPASSSLLVQLSASRMIYHNMMYITCKYIHAVVPVNTFCTSKCILYQ